jgi:type II secretory pathway component GspD/PulD (secretin)
MKTVIRPHSAKYSLSAALSLLLATGAMYGVQPAFGQAPMRAAQDTRIPRVVRLQFVNTDVSDVLQAISMKTRASVVYSAQTKRPISLNISASSVSEAIGFAASAAGLAYREIKGRYFVAPAADLKQLIESFGSTETVELTGMQSAEAITLLTGALPYLTVRPAGNRVILTGDPADIAQAKVLLTGQPKVTPVPSVSEVVQLKQLSPEQTASMLQALYPGLKAEGTANAAKTGGAVGIYGMAADVKAAKETILKLDASVAAPAVPTATYTIYHVKYAGADGLKAFLKDALPSVTAISGPDHINPPAPIFKPLSSASAATGGSSGGASSSGGSGGGGTSAGGAGAGGASNQGTSQDADRVTMLVLSGSEVAVTTALKLLEQVDIAPVQVMIEVKVVDVSQRAQRCLALTGTGAH